MRLKMKMGMMTLNSFLTIEDVNGALYSNQGFYWHEIDTSKISSDSDFDWTKYDFCEVKRETGTFGDFTHRFSFKIHHSNWAKGLYILKNNGDRLTSYTKNFSNNVLTISTNEESIKVFLYFGLTSYSSTKMINAPLINNILGLNYKELNTTQTIKVWGLTTKEEKTTTADVNVGFNAITYSGNDCGFLLVNLLKTNFQFNCNQILTVGKVNKVYLGTNADYKPSGDMVGSYAPTITVQYGDETLPVTYDGNDYSFNLDLTDKTETGKIRFKVLVEANEVLNSSETEVALTSQYQTISTFSALVSACGVNGNDIVRLGANLTATSDIPVAHSIKIIGNEHSIDLNGHKFILNEDVTFNAEKLSFNNGDTAIIQQSNTRVELTSCTFQNCTSSNYNGLGSCIYCDVDIDSLQISNDYETILTDCLFTNNGNCILHGGELTVTGCTLENNDITNINTNNVAFVYQTDGICLIQQSKFTIDYSGNTLCSNQTNIGFAQCLIMCGETAQINGAAYVELGTDGTLPFFEAPFNNRADLTAKYYYPQITNCVESVGTIANKACCHAVSGVDWVFKNNVTVRRLE